MSLNSSLEIGLKANSQRVCSVSGESETFNKDPGKHIAQDIL